MNRFIKSIHTFVFTFLLLVSLLLSNTFWAGGKDFYTPTKAEWLVLVLNQKTNSTIAQDVRYSWFATGNDAFGCMIFYPKDMLATELETKEEFARSMLSELVKKKHWSWAKVTFLRTPY